MKITTLLLGTISFICAVASNGQTPFFITNGLVAYYPFQGNANDATGNGFNAQILGNAVLATDRFGHTNNAYHFDGTTAEIQVTNTIINIGQQGYTLSGWFSFDDITRPEQQVFNSSPETGFGEGFNGGGNPEDLQGGIGPAQPDTWTVVPILGAKTDYVNTNWYQIIFTKNGTTFTSYIDGQVDFQINVPQASGYNAQVGLEFGAVNDAIAFFQGRLDDFRIYNRALPTNEVLGLYNYELTNEVNVATNACTPRDATATATVDHGFVVATTITDPGCGYTNTPSVLISGGGGTGATATAAISDGGVVTITITDFGTGYTSAPEVIISPPGNCIRTATATATVDNGFVVAGTLTDSGCGYTNAPVVVITGGGGSGATAVAVVTNGVVTGIMITATGSGYTSAPDIILSPPEGCVPHTATATATVDNGFVVGATLTDLGCGYSNGASVVIAGGGGTGATATAVVTNGEVVNILITATGSGYTSAPYIAISPPVGCVPHSATGTLTISNGMVISGTITDGGCGYTNAPVIEIVGGGGTGATATAIFTNGEVVGIIITAPGSGYTSNPTAYFASPIGSQISLLQAVVPSFSNLSIGENYQLQGSTDLITWTDEGPPFVATNTTMNSTQFFIVNSKNQLYFRLQGAP